MKSHTLILTVPKIDIPESNILEFAKDLIVSNLVNIDYFGVEQDNQADYIDDQMQDTIDKTSYITFHFEHPEIDYKSYDEVKTLQFIINLLEQNKIWEVTNYGKDVDFIL